MKFERKTIAVEESTNSIEEIAEIIEKYNVPGRKLHVTVETEPGYHFDYRVNLKWGEVE